MILHIFDKMPLVIQGFFGNKYTDKILHFGYICLFEIGE